LFLLWVQYLFSGWYTCQFPLLRADEVSWEYQQLVTAIDDEDDGFMLCG